MNTAPTNLPIVDFAPFSGDASAKRATARAIDTAIGTHGFFYLKNHGIPAALIETCFAQAKAFFDLPRAEKQKIHITHSPCHRGWYFHGEEVLDAHNQPEGDHKEGLKIGHDLPASHPFVRQKIPLHGANQWPDGEPQSPAFKQAMQETYTAFAQCAHRLMRALALGLGLSETHFDPYLACPMATLSPIRYPPLATPDSPKSAAAHTDFGCLTLLAQADQRGLEVQSQSGAWQPAPPVADTLLVNIGDMMEVWSAGRYISTRHRVRNLSGQMRHSLAFFYDPQYDTPLRALTQTATETETQTITALEHLLNKIDASFEYAEYKSG